MARSTSEWIGKTDDTKAPPRVRDRIFQRAGHVCHLCQLEIKVAETWDLDHVTALINGGENRESNMAPAHKHCHVVKTDEDVKLKAKIAKTRQKHTGITRPTQKIQSRGFAPTAKSEKRAPKAALPPRQLFERTDA